MEKRTQVKRLTHRPCYYGADRFCLHRDTQIPGQSVLTSVHATMREVYEAGAWAEGMSLGEYIAALEAEYGQPLHLSFDPREVRQ